LLSNCEGNLLRLPSFGVYPPKRWNLNSTIGTHAPNDAQAGGGLADDFKAVALFEAACFSAAECDDRDKEKK
jgi:hypothetical protein